MDLKVANLIGGYGGKVVVNEICFDAVKGDMIYVLGPNGSGKTTMFNMLIGYKRRISGDVLIDGENIDEYSNIELARRVAYIPQHHEPAFNYTVEDIVLMGRTCHINRFASPKQSDYNIVRQSLNMLGIENLIHIEYLELSGGQRQQVLIARALCQQAKILIMDEPLTGLDFNNKAVVTKTLNELVKRGHIVIMSTHNAINNYSDDAKILLIDSEGKSVFGNIEEMIEGNIIQKAYNTPLQTIKKTDEKGGRHLLYLPI